MHFEKLAKQCEWNKKNWVLLIQSSFTGKAQEVYAALGIDESSNYDVVKKTILKAYDLVPEAYRQKFRNCRKVEGQTFVEFARKKESLFDKWCRATGVDTLEKMRQLMLVEEFKRCTFNGLHTYLDEKQVNTLARAATIADEYVLTHKGSFHKSTKFDGRKRVNEPVDPAVEKSENQDKVQSEKGDQSTLTYKGRPFKQCNHCNKKGHVRDECWHLKKKIEKPIAFVSNIESGFNPFIT